MPDILGAGAVGLALGARLARAGLPVTFHVRRPEVAASLARDGLQAEDPVSEEAFEVPVRATAAPPEADGEPLLLCVRVSDVPPVSRALAAAGCTRPVVAFQNDLDAEQELAQRLPAVVGGVWRQTCTRVSDRQVRYAGAGRAIVGAYPCRDAGRAADAATTVAGWLERAGFDVGVSQAIGEDKWLKLFVNLMSAPNALVRRDDHDQPAFVEIKVRLLTEARDALRAADVHARSCDGRDRDLDAEIAFQRESLARGTSARRLPLYNQVWASLKHGAPLEAARYHERIVALAREHGLEAPINARVQHAVERASREGLGPESIGACELLGESAGG